MHSAFCGLPKPLRRMVVRTTIAALVTVASACQPLDPGPVPQSQDIYDVAVDTACTRIVSQIKSVEFTDSLPKARQCAYRQDSVRRARAADVANVELQRHGRLLSDIPEFHDEQRLPGDASPNLGPYAGIFTAPFAGSFRHIWQFDEHAPDGILIGYVVVLREGNEALPNSYSNLGLQFGLNCIFVAPAIAGGLQASIIKPQGKACREPPGNVPNKPGTPLQVIVTPVPLDSVVAAARFEEDTQGRTVFGLPCGRNWCRIGRPGFTPFATTFCNWGYITCTRREELFPAWYDEQQWEEVQGGRWVSTSLRVALVPRRDIDANAPTSFGRLYVADLYIRDPLSNTSRLHRKGVRRGKNRVELEKFIDPLTSSEAWQYIITPDPNTEGVTPQPFRVVHGRHKHWDAPIPGTTRFRYTMLDPGIWGPCGQACCPSDGT